MTERLHTDKNGCVACRELRASGSHLTVKEDPGTLLGNHQQPRTKARGEDGAMKALIAIGVCGCKAVLLKTWPEAKGPDDPWGAEIEAAGSSQVGLALPAGDNIAGLWMWEGTTVWRGDWRRATDADLMKLSPDPTATVPPDHEENRDDE